MQTNLERIKNHLEQLDVYTATPDQGTTRLTYSKEDLGARNYLKSEMAKVGLTVSEDAIGNIYGRLEGANPDLPAVIVGSHFDSVPNGGAFDGPAGVITGLEVASVFHEQQIKPYFPLEIIAMVEEEGARFGAGLLASRAITGKVTKEMLHEMKDADGITAAEAMAGLGFDANKVHSAIRTKDSVKAFIELHIEQGPVLESANEDVALVDTVVGLTEIKVTIKGQAGHAGTTPMLDRKDALVAAVEILKELPELAIQEGGGTVLTIGKLNVYPNGANVIPDKVVFTVDIRAKEEIHVLNTLEKTKKIIQSAEKNGITCEIEDMLYEKPTYLSKEIHQALTESADKLGFKYRTMVSGAGHDAMIFAGMTEVGLIFVPSHNGISHAPEEWTDYDQLQKGIEVVLETVKKWTEESANE
ncbi:Zn-dependent hydrolase [Listeria welshimeri]|uniref:Zn-dependent hydrolase n=1 Tax=Listeria welshimeri TaxID=1643 RepID=UPI001624DC13|nr:Zn-dependent hydrolase [Listeria welshimeri]MBC1242585.1 Zn-dependent hydrolase [Listeria welshimeri]MBC1362803.1 Zn-dependent hydrolase [Listeria welshimeri]MBC1395703.1 Zn-dependent hydrolase [Listeria welshimeri]MBC1669561.1 Zn-dependent hydrolase [Listeria welshimeri]MBC1967140.1 Zn-dependent hydrolase [Listeria welshimeri]